jgi:hypothetical protein
MLCIVIVVRVRVLYCDSSVREKSLKSTVILDELGGKINTQRRDETRTKFHPVRSRHRPVSELREI